MTILVSGSVAMDHIMVFPDRFKDHILADKLHILNVSFNIESLDTHFGGTAGNIAFHLKLLGEDQRILATVGNDFDAYASSSAGACPPSSTRATRCPSWRATCCSR